MSKRGLILEGGAMRGLFTAGILDVMLEHDIQFDGIIGVSAGAAFGCNYKSRQIGRVLRYNTRFCRDKRFCSWYSLLKTGDLFGADFCYRELPEELDVFDCRTYNENPVEFWLVCTDAVTGKAHYQPCPEATRACFQWMRASASMPLVSRVVETETGIYLDGAMADSVPLQFFQSQGYDKNVVILTQCAGYRKKPQKAMWLIRAALRKYPEVVKTLAVRHLMYNRTMELIEEQERAGKIFVFRPESPLPLNRICHDPARLRQAWQTGRELALKKYSDLKHFLNS